MVAKEYNGNGTKVKINFSCTEPGCSKVVEEIFTKPSNGDSDVTATCACDTNYEITIKPYDGDVSGIVYIRDENNTLKEEQVTITVI